MYKIDYDHNWGSRGVREVSSFYEYEKPEDICSYLKNKLEKEYINLMGIDVKRIRLGVEYKTNSAHGI